MRYAVLIFAILGCGTAGYLGTRWLSDASTPLNRAVVKLIRTDPKELVNDQEFKDLITKLKPEDRLVMVVALSSPETMKEAKQQPGYKDLAAKMEGAIRAAYCLLLAIPLGLAGGTVGFFRKIYVAGGLLIAAALLPVIFMPFTFVFTIPLLIAGVLAFLVRQERPPSKEKKKARLREEED